MKQLILSILLISTLVSADPVKNIYVVDMQKVFNESIPGKALRSDMEATMSKAGDKLKAMEAELKKMVEDLEKQKSLLSETAFKEKAKLVYEKRNGMESQAQKERESVAGKRDKIFKALNSEISDVIKMLADKNGYEFVMEKDPSVIVYAKNDFDITSKVIEELDDRKVSIN